MKNLLKIFLIAAFAVAAASCSKTEEDVVYLQLTPFNIDGIWQLSEWNGEPLADGSYAYIEFDRRDMQFTSYSNIETSSPVIEPGTFGIYQEENAIWGYYEYDNQRWWTHKYVVSELTSDRMVWTAQDDPSEVRVYVRIDALPDGIAPDSSDDSEE